MTGRSRGYCFTLNNYRKRDIKSIKQIPCRYMVVGKEVGEQGTKHLQGYIYFDNARSFSSIKKLIPKAHIEAAKGSPQQNREYCTKDKDFFEAGDIPTQGKRVDLNEVKKKIEEGTSVEQLTIQDPMLYHQYGRTLNKLEDICMLKRYRTEMTKGIWLHGPADAGKTHIAMQGYTPDTHYVHPVHDKGWWDNYRQQPTVIINDFRGGIAYNELLQLVDKWPHSVPRRGRQPIPFTSKLVYITSPLRPEEVYYNLAESDSLDQLFRRFEVVEVKPRKGKKNKSIEYNAKEI